MSSWTEEELQYLKLNYSTEPAEKLETELSRSYDAIRKKAEREGLSRHPQIGLINSIREAPEPRFPDEDFNNYIVGLVDGEGCFTTKGEQFQFSIQMVRDDFDILRQIGDYWGVGNTSTYNRENENYSEMAHYAVQNYGELVSVVIPFFEQYPPRAHKKQFQFNYWAESVLSKANFDTERFK